MPLPEDDQRQLQEIERALYADDPKFARRIRAGDPRVRYKRTLLRVLPGVVSGGGQPAAVPSRGPARAFGGGDHGGDGHERPARAGQAGPDDGSDGPALAPPPGR